VDAEAASSAESAVGERVETAGAGSSGVGFTRSESSGKRVLEMATTKTTKIETQADVDRREEDRANLRDAGLAKPAPEVWTEKLIVETLQAETAMYAANDAVARELRDVVRAATREIEAAERGISATVSYVSGAVRRAEDRVAKREEAIAVWRTLAMLCTTAGVARELGVRASAAKIAETKK
jgi:hypothetical protein